MTDPKNPNRPFLDRVILESGAATPSVEKRQLFIFPNRRAGIHFKKHLASHLRGPAWAPEVMSLSDFIARQSPLRPADRMTLLFELYEVYRSINPEEDTDFEAFIPWGQMMLRDFDEVDRYLVDARLLFTQISEVHRLEEDFGPQLSDYEAFKNFWRTFAHEPLSKVRKEFARIWRQLYPIYRQFKKRLNAKKLAYEGMIYRELADDPGWVDKLPYTEIYLCGFNALTRSEMKIFKKMLASGMGRIFWDADAWYLDNPKAEAGHHLRENFRQLPRPEPSEVANALISLKKEIEIIGSPRISGQAAATALTLDQWLDEEGFRDEKTALVLADEEALFPLLYTLPESIQHLNVTMGYPLRFSFTHHFAISWLALFEHAREEDGKLLFYSRDVSRFFAHPFMRWALDSTGDRVIESMRKENILYPDEAFFKAFHHDFLNRIFQRPEKEELPARLRTLLVDAAAIMESKSPEAMRQEREFVLQYHKMLQRLEDQLEHHRIRLSAQALAGILDQLSRSESLPFSGEPLEGLQIMGLLETRALDFDRIIVIGANEGKLPAGSRHHSYIPYDLRKAFGMNTFEQQDQLFAYHFYRLLQRSRHAVLLYDTHIGPLSEGEPSRFLRQVEHELAPFHSISHRKSEITPRFGDTVDMPVRKDESVQKALEAYLEEGGKCFSPSSLAMLFSCPLRFYFEKILGIREEQLFEDELDAARLGTIFHNTMEALYKLHLGQPMKAEYYAEMEQKLEGELLKQYRKEYHSRMKKPMGKNLLNFQYLLRSARYIFRHEKRLLEEGRTLSIESVENPNWSFLLPVTVNGETKKVRISGIIDRVDRLDGQVRIIDYKTGSKVELKEKALTDPSLVFDNPDNKATLQGIIYALLYLEQHPDERVSVDFYHLKKISEGPKELFKNPVSLSDFELFKSALCERLASLYDPNESFLRTDKEKECSYCQFQMLCGR